MALCILSLNCNRMQDLSKRTGLLQWLQSLPVGDDVVCLPETHCVSSAECGTDRWLSAIRLDDGSIVSSPAELCASFAVFYTSLFSAAPTDPVIRASLLADVSSSLAPDMAPSVRPFWT